MTGKKHSQVFLKAIHIQGFKSFADKIKLEFKPGLSVIVGPNGSGKSNIADAVRWVLGEQSAKSLRGTKMEDVIFSGSSARRPVGMAEVSLIFDNSAGLLPLDYEEVTITRRVYRNGEGQYFINRTPCRLKDIQELFLDTGSGKEGFSIIGQGRVEEILNLKAEERRLLIEEVAGISKFRLRKKEALRKLEETEQNLSRLGDIIGEVKDRLEPLARQAETAQNCLELAGKLKDTEIKLIASELSDINNRVQKAEKGVIELTTELTGLTTKIAEEENISQRAKYELGCLEEQIQDLQGEVHGFETNLKEITHELALLTERHGYIKEQLERLEKEVNSEQEKLNFTSDKIEKLEDKEKTLTTKLEETNEKLNLKEKQLAELRSLCGGSRIEYLKTEIFEELTNKTRLFNELKEIEHKNNSYQGQKEQLLQEKEQKETVKENISAEIKSQQEEEKKCAEKELWLKQELESIERKLKDKESQLKSAQESCSRLIRQLDQVNARLHALQALEENMEGYHKGVRKTIFAYRKGEISCKGIYGTVAENIEVDKEYELAVETALGNALQNIIVETTEDAKKCIAYLKAANGGRATFLPLDAVRGKRLDIDIRLKTFKGFLGLGVDLVRFEERFRPVMEFLLGRILVADTMDTAVKLAKAQGYKVRVVTLQGDQVNPGGSLTGGSSKNLSSGLLGRTREIDELEKRLKNLSQETAREKEKCGMFQEQITELANKKAELEGEIKNLAELKNIMTVERRHNEDRVKRLSESIELLEFQIREADTLLREFQAKQDGLESELRRSENKLAGLQAEQEELEKIIKEKTEEAQLISDEITAFKIEAARWEQELAQTRELIAEEKERCRLSKNVIEEKNKEISNLKAFSEELVRRQDDAEKSIQENRKYLEEKRYLLVELRKKREMFSADLLKKEHDIELLRRRAKEIEQQLHQNEIRIARWQAEWETGITRLREEHALSWEEAGQYLTDEKKDLLQEKITALKQQIEELGPVNYAALEEYPETLKRYEFLTSQQDDLIEAGKSLQELIEELDRCMIERFAEGFKAVNKAFQEVFRELFNGGHAELCLDDPDNLLETGVKIIAQPPGKKAQLLSLLSGGERAFTAIALLFAFLKVKPSPFCLLDEIEAALDEANVKRFAQYIRKLSDSTQFILISHRRGTMESADRLYGITMEESGVSKLLTVELDEGFEDSITA